MIFNFNPLSAQLNPICHLLALLGAHHIFHVSKIRVNINVFLTVTVGMAIQLAARSNADIRCLCCIQSLAKDL
jgi:hypothetical protein